MSTRTRRPGTPSPAGVVTRHQGGDRPAAPTPTELESHVTTEATGEPAEELEVHLEELGQHSWVKALFNTLSGSYGSAQFRFVARPAGLPDHPSRHVAVSGTFPVMRWADLDDEVEPHTWLDLARDSLADLDDDLVSQGWRRRPERGRHWWSLRYGR